MGSWGSIYNSMVYGLREHSAILSSLQEQVASGARILRASDGPSDAFQIAHLGLQCQTMNIYLKNIGQVLGDLEQASDAFLQLNDLLSTARSLMHQAASGTYTPEQRRANGEAVDQLLEQAVWLANLKVAGEYIFSGEDCTVQPYVVERTDGRITSVQYQGSTRSLYVPVALGVEEERKLVGEELFRSQDRQDPVFMGNTGAQAGTGTSTVRGDVWLTVTHGTTTYAGTTGVAAGSRSAPTGCLSGLRWRIRGARSLP